MMIIKEFLEPIIKEALPKTNYLINESYQIAEVYVEVGVTIKIERFNNAIIPTIQIKAPGQSIFITKELLEDKTYLIKTLQNVATVSKAFQVINQYLKSYSK